MKKILPIFLIVACAACFGKLGASEIKVGFVNFKDCIEKSKYGQQEKNAFETLKKQMSETLEKADQELEVMAKKLEDQDYMDSLSPTAEEELKFKFQGMSQEYARYQNQFYQLLNQANYKMIQTMHEEVSLASEQIREKNNLALLLNEESTFAYSSSLDFTDEVVEKMNQQFELENKEVAD